MTPGRRRFRFIKEIAEGGFGKVYLAEQLSTDGFSRIVAVKLLHAKWSSHDEVVMRTRDEARLLGLIRHQHIVKVEDLTSIDGKCAIVMEYLEGVDLKSIANFLKERGEEFPRAALFEVMLGVCSALDAAYNGLPLQGAREPLRVLHRDIKPSNIFVTVAGQVKLLDFGTARANFAEREAKTQALAFGSQGYMAPERMLGEEDTPKADIFSLGVTLMEMLTGENFGRIPPRPNKFTAKVQEKVAAVNLTGDRDWQAQVRETLASMLAYEPGERPSAAELVERFEILAQNAKDTQLRKFCRTSVAEAKASEPEVNSGDPLVNNTVDEDASSAFGLVSGVPDMTNPAGVTEGLPPSQGAQTNLPPPPGSRTPAPAPRATGTRPAAMPSQPRVSASSMPDAAEPAPKSGGGFLKIAIGLFVVGLILAVVLGGLAVVVGGGAAVAVGSGAVGGPSTTAPEPPPEPEPKVDVKIPSGGKVLKADDKEGVARSKSTLKGSVPDGAEIIIQGPRGFKAEWDGKTDFDIGSLAEGKYLTNITLASGQKVRGKGFTVEGNKACEFKFDPGKQDWTGQCS